MVKQHFNNHQKFELPAWKILKRNQQRKEQKAIYLNQQLTALKMFHQSKWKLWILSLMKIRNNNRNQVYKTRNKESVLCLLIQLIDWMDQLTGKIWNHWFSQMLSEMKGRESDRVILKLRRKVQNSKSEGQESGRRNCLKKSVCWSYPRCQSRKDLRLRTDLILTLVCRLLELLYWGKTIKEYNHYLRLHF